MCCNWKRKEKKEEEEEEEVIMAKYVRLVDNKDVVEEEEEHRRRVRKGYVPVMVGEGDGPFQRFELHVSKLKEPRVLELLDTAAREFGYGTQAAGVLRIPCGIRTFRELMSQPSPVTHSTT